MRVATLNTSTQALAAIESRQAEQARLQSQLSSGLRVQTPGDDPVAAAQAELARSRLAQLSQDQRAQQLAASLLSAADSALGQGVGLLQSARETLVAAGDAAYTDADRQALAVQLDALRAQLLGVANMPDGAGGYVFGGQGSASAPFGGGSSPAYAPDAGEQRMGAGGAFAASLDGRSVFLCVAQGNGVFTTAAAGANTGTGFISAGDVASPAQLTGHGYSIAIAGAAGSQTYTVTDTSTGATVANAQAFTAGAPITIDGQRFTIDGAPAAGDGFTLAPAGRQSVFKTLDDAIALLRAPGVAPSARAGRLQGLLAGLDRALDGFSLARTGVGTQLARVDQAAAANADQALATTQRLGDLRDVDMAAAITQLQSGQAGLEAALRSYMLLGRTSLFQLLG